jgi:hypothetical protein
MSESLVIVIDVVVVVAAVAAADGKGQTFDRWIYLIDQSARHGGSIGGEVGGTKKKIPPTE